MPTGRLAISSIVMVPDQNFGVIVVANRSGSSLPKTSAAIVDMFLDLEAPKREKSRDSEELHPLTPSDLSRYAGTYVDPWYGRMTIAPSPTGLTIDFNDTPRMNGPLEHFQYDSFIARFTDRQIEPAYVSFAIDADGRVERVSMKPVSPTADFSFDYQDLHFVPVAAERR